MKRKAQEEIIGFVLIMIIVAVIFVVFLGINIRNPQVSERQSEIIYQFLESSMEQTTECSIANRQELLDLSDLISECYSTSSECSNGENSCVLLEDTFNDILSSSFAYGEEYPLKGYSLESIYSINSSNQGSNQETVVSILKGNCNGSISGNSYWAPEFPGSITTTLKLCY